MMRVSQVLSLSARSQYALVVAEFLEESKTHLSPYYHNPPLAIPVLAPLATASKRKTRELEHLSLDDACTISLVRKRIGTVSNTNLGNTVVDMLQRGVDVDGLCERAEGSVSAELEHRSPAALLLPLVRRLSG